MSFAVRSAQRGSLQKDADRAFMLATLGRGGNRCWVLVRLEDGPFDQAVKVHGTCAGQAQHIGSARQASEWLFYQWPAEEDTDKGVAGRA
jgi:hypothetical protein